MMKELTPYKVMWVFVMFDLPTESKADRKDATRFRNDLLKSGFSMMQYSVYIRVCGDAESTEKIITRVKRQVPDNGRVSILKVTDKQFGNIINFTGRQKKRIFKTPTQLTIF